MTGWGQTGPRACRPATTSTTSRSTACCTRSAARASGPVPPLNLTGDFGGGSMFLLVGILSALWERQTSGKGQVVDAAMVDGSSVLMQMMWGVPRRRHVDRRARHQHARQRRAVLRHLRMRRRPLRRGRLRSSRSSTRELLEGLGLDGADLPDQNDVSRWPELRARSPRSFASKDRDHWAKVFAGTDACVDAGAVVRRGGDRTAHHRTRHLLPRRRRTCSRRPRRGSPAACRPTPTPPGEPGADTEAVLRDWV